METAAWHSIEIRRREEQLRLDLLKSALERNKLGQFATPPKLALSLARYARDLLGPDPVRFLDPAVGTGSFYSALLQVFGSRDIDAANGIEIDPLFADTAHELWAAQGLDIVKGDFTKQIPSQRHNLVLTNPPYVRHHHVSLSDKEQLRAQVFRSLQLNISGLAGLYCYFMLLCHDWMEEQGVAVWLIPSEFMDVNYGVALRRYLTEHVTLLHVHRFCPTDLQFADALVSSVVVVFRKSLPEPETSVRFSFGGLIDEPQSESTVPLDALRRSRKWTHFPALATPLRGETQTTLGDIFSIKRGLATGCNDFFILDESDIEKWQIPNGFLRPILPSPRHVTKDIIDVLPGGSPDISPRLFVLDCSEPEAHIRSTWPRFSEYLQIGHERKISETYLASRRVPWFSQERRPPAPFLCTYMGRFRDGRHPFRFIWNRSQATAHNVYLMLYPKGPLRRALREKPELHELVFEALKSIPPAQLRAEGRVYGGGLHKVEPKELSQIPAHIVLESIKGHIRIERQEELFA